MIRFYIFIILFAFPQVFMGQTLTMEVQHYFVVNNCKVDTVHTIIYDVSNSEKSPIAIFFTEDDIAEYPLDLIVKRRVFRRYGDYNLWSWTDNICNQSEYINFPHYFFKVVSPDDHFKLYLNVKKHGHQAIDSLIRKHLVIIVFEEKNKDIIGQLTKGMKKHHADYIYSSITINWEDLERFLKGDAECNE